MKWHADDTIPVTESRASEWHPIQCKPNYKFITIDSHTSIIEGGYLLEGNSSNQRELSGHVPPSDCTAL